MQWMKETATPLPTNVNVYYFFIKSVARTLPIKGVFED